MTIQQLFILLEPFLHPLVDLLGTICLILLVAAGVLWTAAWIIRRIWKYVLAAGAVLFLVAVLALTLGVI